MAFIEKGMAAIMDPHCRESDEIRIQLVLHPGDHVGEMGLMEKTPRKAARPGGEPKRRLRQGRAAAARVPDRLGGTYSLSSPD